MGTTKTRQHTVGVTTGHAMDDDVSEITDDDGDKYRIRRHSDRHVLGLLVLLLLLFFLGRYLAWGRYDRQVRYARAQAFLEDAKESNTRHRDRRRQED